MNRAGRNLVAMLAGLLSAPAGGCTALEDGAREGLESGISAALAALIEVPITFALEQAFGANGG